MAQLDDNFHSFARDPVSPVKEAWNEEQEQWDDERRVSNDSLQRTPPRSPASIKRKAVPAINQPEVRLHEAPVSPVNVNPPTPGLRDPDTASIQEAPMDGYFNGVRQVSSSRHSPDAVPQIDSNTMLAFRNRPPSGPVRMVDDQNHSRASSGSFAPIDEDRVSNGEVQQEPEQQHEGLQYHAFDDAPKKRSQNRISQMTTHSAHSSSSGSEQRRASQQLGVPRQHAVQRPISMISSASDLRGRTLSPLSAHGSDQSSPSGYPRDSSSRRSAASRPTSYIDLLNNVPYNQQFAPAGEMSHQSLQSAVGNAASLLDTKKTLEMYRANVKKTNDAAVQYEFAIFMINSARDLGPTSGLDPSELITEAKNILQHLADRAYPFAQYYLGDGFFSGLFNKDKPDYNKAFSLFVAASKHGHAEAGYRAALCYEFGWGTTKSYPKAVQFYRNAASKNHPGAATRIGMACINRDMGLDKSKYKEGVKWLKRAQESADFQYNAAPYELGIMHLTGYGSDIFKDEKYAAQLFTQSAELGHVQANYLMGQAYENGLYGCPRDAALSVHFYNGAASKGMPEAQMALCAWYMVGAEPVLDKDEGEACAWAKQAAESGMAKAEYAVGYFTEMGIGCRRDPLEANVWYVRAADQGYEAAKQRLQIIRAAAAGASDPGVPMMKAEAKTKELGGGGGKEKGKKFMGIF